MAARVALELWSQIERGIDPLEEKAKEKERLQIPDFQTAARLVHAENLPTWSNVKHGQQWINTLETYVFPVLGALPLDAIEPRHVVDALRPIWLSKAETASRVRYRIHAVMAWGWAHGFCVSNPVDVVEHLLPKQEGRVARTVHHPAMAWKDIPDFVQKHVRIDDKSNVTRSILEFLILTAARSGEVRGAVWSEIDWENKVWEIPASRMKMKTAHRVPLSDRAMAILKNQQGLHEEFIRQYGPNKLRKKEELFLALHYLDRHEVIACYTDCRPAYIEFIEWYTPTRNEARDPRQAEDFSNRLSRGGQHTRYVR